MRYPERAEKNGRVRGDAAKESQDLVSFRRFCIARLEKKITECRVREKQLQEECCRTEGDMKQIIRYSHLEVLTQEVVDTFIKKIYVFKDKRVGIEWNFRENGKEAEFFLSDSPFLNAFYPFCKMPTFSCDILNSYPLKYIHSDICFIKTGYTI